MVRGEKIYEFLPFENIITDLRFTKSVGLVLSEFAFSDFGSRRIVHLRLLCNLFLLRAMSAACVKRLRSLLPVQIESVKNRIDNPIDALGIDEVTIGRVRRRTSRCFRNRLLVVLAVNTCPRHLGKSLENRLRSPEVEPKCTCLRSQAWANLATVLFHQFLLAVPTVSSQPGEARPTFAPL